MTEDSRTAGSRRMFRCQRRTNRAAGVVRGRLHEYTVEQTGGENPPVHRAVQRDSTGHCQVALTGGATFMLEHVQHNPLKRFLQGGCKVAVNSSERLTTPPG